VGIIIITMALSHKVFMTTALLILALAGVGTWSLLAISRLVDVNRAIATQAVPALRGGSGLGLAIVKGLVEAHGGRVGVVSQEGKGSSFLVCLPRDGRASAEAPGTQS
jgi:hypothetical protein